jgi:hypothetical protein
LREGLGREVGERRPAPERECCPQRVCRPLWLVCGEELSTLCELTLEAQEVELFRLDCEQVSVAPRLQAAVPERLAQPRHEDVNAVQCTCGRAVPPERIDQAIRRDHFPRAEEEQCEQRLLLAGADLDSVSALPHLEPAENAELQSVCTSQAWLILRPHQARRKSRSTVPQAQRRMLGAGRLLAREVK